MESRGLRSPEVKQETAHPFTISGAGRAARVRGRRTVAGSVRGLGWGPGVLTSHPHTAT